MAGGPPVVASVLPFLTSHGETTGGEDRRDRLVALRNRVDSIPIRLDSAASFLPIESPRSVCPVCVEFLLLVPSDLSELGRKECWGLV